MRKIKVVSSLILALALFSSCGDDDKDDQPTAGADNYYRGTITGSFSATAEGEPRARENYLSIPGFWWFDFGGINSAEMSKPTNLMLKFTIDAGEQVEGTYFIVGSANDTLQNAAAGRLEPSPRVRIDDVQYRYVNTDEPEGAVVINLATEEYVEGTMSLFGDLESYDSSSETWNDAGSARVEVDFRVSPE